MMQLPAGVSHTPPPKGCTTGSLKPSEMMSLRILPTSTTWASLTSISTPPVKSMPRLKPCQQMEMTETSIRRPSMAKATKRYLTKSKLVVSGVNRNSGMGGTSRKIGANLQGAGGANKRPGHWPNALFLLEFRPQRKGTTMNKTLGAIALAMLAALTQAALADAPAPVIDNGRVTVRDVVLK